MRYPKPLPPGGTIGFIAPSFGCAIEPYRSRFDNALRIFRKMGYKTVLGPNCYEGSGIGISNTPERCGAELNAAMIRGRFENSDESIDTVITCGGGELMCEVVPYIDFDEIGQSEPRWYMGYSDNTNYTFLSTILADTAAIYGPCAPAFGRVPWHASVADAMKLLTGEVNESRSYPLWEKEDYNVDELDESLADAYPFLSYNATEPAYYHYYPEDTDGADMHGRLIGGCVDILTLLIGTKFDKVSEFLERYREDGFIWFLECCDLNPLSMRRAYWQMKEAGWFKYVKGFLIGRPLHFGEDAMGVDQYNAVTDIIGDFGVPIVMDVDIGHLPPMMPIISGALADVECKGNETTIRYIYE